MREFERLGVKWIARLELSYSSYGERIPPATPFVGFESSEQQQVALFESWTESELMGATDAELRQALERALKRPQQQD